MSFPENKRQEIIDNILKEIKEGNVSPVKKIIEQLNSILLTVNTKTLCPNKAFGPSKVIFISVFTP